MPSRSVPTRAQQPQLTHLPAVLTAGLGACLAACSGGGGGATSSTGRFVDSAVEGLSFVTLERSGVTDFDGTFVVELDAEVEFRIGDVVLGSAPVSDFMTPVTLVPGAGNELHPTVTNIARLLQSVDANGQPLDGITIPAAVRSAGAGLSIDFGQSAAAFGADPGVAALLQAAGAGALVTVADAQLHLRRSLLVGLAGLYRGTFSGDDSGSFEVLVDRSGAVLGAAVANSDTSLVIGVDGAMQSDGSGLFGNTTDGASFSGEIAGGGISGSWTNPFFGESGTFSGNLQGNTQPFVDGMLPFVGVYFGSYAIGGESGTFDMIVDARGAILLNLSDAGGVAIVERVQGNTAIIVGMLDDGTVMTGTLAPQPGGAASGTLSNSFFGETGTFSGNAP